MIFNKTGLCLYHHDIAKSKREGTLRGLIDIDRTDKKHDEQEKLVFGLIWSLKSFASTVACDSPNQPSNAFKNFSTSQYSLHFFEVPTGLKIALLTNPTSSSSLVLGGQPNQNLQPQRTQMYQSSVPAFHMPSIIQSGQTSEYYADQILLKLSEFYEHVYVPLVSRNVPFCPVQAKIKSQVFSARVESFFGV